jgi:zinc transporter
MPDSAPLPPCHGLIAGWNLTPGPGSHALSEAAVPEALGQGNLWLHFDLLDARARAFIQALPGLPRAARLALVDPDEAIRIDVLDEALFGCLPDIHYDAEDAEVPAIGMLHFALTPSLLITARRHPLRGVHEALQGPEAESPANAFATVLRGTALEFGRGTAALAQKLGRIEDRLLRPNPDPPDEALAGIQREGLRLYRHLDPLAEGLDELDEDPPAWLIAAGDPLVRERRRIRQAVRALVAIRERARIAQDQASAQATGETNRRLLVLSVISAAMLPASLVAGIFGMNVGGVPGVPGEGFEAGWGFAMAMALIAASVGGVLAALRVFRLL